MDGHRFLDDLALLVVLRGALVLLEQVNAFDHDLVFGWECAENFARFAAVLAGNHYDAIAFVDFHDELHDLGGKRDDFLETALP